MSYVKELHLPDDIGQGDLFNLLQDLQDSFSNDDEDSIDSAYYWALSRAIGCVRSDINFYEAQSTLLNILKDSNISDTDCRNKCVKYLESKYPMN